ncbi:MAG: hypothetical protein RBS08_10155 [Bdellovibrionales bacterium]|jgi:hypothetical protein|nr:hypothetical protein [Bdellovibrionales bacterium]
MRGLFQHKAQRDSLRPELKQEFKKSNDNNAGGASREKRFDLQKLMSVFVLAALANEASHFHQTHNPHGNRRERIEEIRMRLSEAEVNSRGQRSLNAGGNPPPQPNPAVEAALEASGRRRNLTLQG